MCSERGGGELVGAGRLAVMVHTARRRSCGCGGGGSARRAHREGTVGVGRGDEETLEAFHSSVSPGSSVGAQVWQ